MTNAVAPYTAATRNTWRRFSSAKNLWWPGVLDMGPKIAGTAGRGQGEARWSDSAGSRATETAAR